MKKNFKFLSSLALAGILATNVMGVPSFAATTDNMTKTEPVGIYQKLVQGKKVVPFVLANREDKVTIKDIKDSGRFNMTQFNGLAVPAENTVVCTGDTFKSNGEEYTVVIYGDVNKDGSISVVDALAIQQYRANIEGATLDPIQLEAANVMRADGSGVNIVDALHIQQYRAKITDTIIDKLPAEEQEEVNYTATISINENGYINAENIDSTTVGIKLSQTSDKETTLTVKVLNAEGEEITVAGLSGTIKVAAHTDYQKIEGVDFSALEDGKLTIQLVNEDKTVAGTVTTEINTVLPAVAQVRTERTSTSNATISFNNMGDSDIVKMYYVVAQTEPTWDSSKNEFTGLTTKTMAVSNSKVENAQVSDELTTKETYKVYFVVENSYGSKSEMVSADILSDTVNKQVEKVKEITVPELEENKKDFTWEAVEGANGYIVTLYKDGKIVEEVERTECNYALAMNTTGKYQISVVAKGDNTTSKNSEATLSAEVEITALKAVTGVTFEMNTEGKAMLSWTDANQKEDVKGYTVKLYQLDEEGKYGETPVAEYPATETKQEITITANKVYKAEVVAVAKTDEQAKIVDSEKATLEGFYKIETDADLAEVTENSVTLTLDDVKVNGKSANYQVKVYKVREGNNPEEPLYTLSTTKKVEVKDGKIVVDGLESNKTYIFKLIADVDGIKGESDYIAEATTLRKTPEIKNLTVVKTEEEAKAGTIYKNGTTLIVNGEKHDLTSNYSADFKNMVQVIDTLHAKDIVTIEGETVTLDLPSEASSESLNFGTAAKDMTIVIESNGFEKQIATTAGSEPKEVILKGGEARFNVSGLNTKKLTLTSGVTVTGNKEYTVNAGATVTINGVKVTTQKETVINAAGKVLNVTANKETNNLVFENLIAENITETEATIKFVGTPDLTSKQLGTITIKTTGGKVTVEQENVNVSSTLNVEVNSGEVVVQNEAFTGDKNITVTNKKEGTTTVEAIAKTKAPVAMTNVELKDYTEEEFKTAFPTVTKAEDIAAVKEYINSFGINGKGAKITVAKDSSNVTIVFSEAVENVNISNIK